jgi:hypothetical protein
VDPLIVIVVLGIVVWVVSAPLRHARAGRAEDRVAVERDGLLAAKEAKYREIRELELDHRTGKLSEEDFRVQDRARRAEAIEILRQIDALGELEPDVPVVRAGPAAVSAEEAGEEEPELEHATVPDGADRPAA